MTREERLPPDTESRLGEFTALMATAISNAEARAEVERLAEEQAALRRVATLVARESSPMEVFGAVTEEAWRALDTEAVGMLRFDSDVTATLVAQSHTPWDPPPLGTRFTLEGENIIAQVLRTGRAVRVDDWASATGQVAAMASGLGIRSSVATPIVVDGRLWGTMVAVTSQSEPLPGDTESRIGQFTELVATAIANAGARSEVEQLADEQAALRRVATLVAEGVSPQDLFEAVAVEVGRLLPVGGAEMGRLRAGRERHDGGLVGRARLPFPPASGGRPRARMSRRWCSRRAGPPASTTSLPLPPTQSASPRGRLAPSQRLAARSSSTAISGA
jgi:GAF domain-containing protein